MRAGRRRAYALYLTTAAPEGLRAELREFAAATGSTQWTGALLAQASEGTPAAAPLGLLGGPGRGGAAACLRAHRRAEGPTAGSAGGAWNCT